MKRIENLENSLKPLQQSLKTHSLYHSLNQLDDIKLFMKRHVFAVWDFMSLLKYLQAELTTVQTPWVPKGNAKLARFINEIVIGEESDLNDVGEPQSHFEMYLDAMKQAGVSTGKINKFLAQIASGTSVPKALKRVNANPGVADFVSYSYHLIKEDKAHKVAAAFTFGRENVIPTMFIEILKKADPKNKSYNKLRYYLERHVELDGDEHGPLSLEMVNQLCGDDDRKWKEAEITARESLQKRIKLWDAIESDINDFATL